MCVFVLPGLMAGSCREGEHFDGLTKSCIPCRMKCRQPPVIPRCASYCGEYILFAETNNVEHLTLKLRFIKMPSLKSWLHRTGCPLLRLICFTSCAFFKQESALCVATPGHYFDRLVKKCVRCAKICGRHPAECSHHCSSEYPSVLDFSFELLPGLPSKLWTQLTEDKLEGDWRQRKQQHGTSKLLQNTSGSSINVTLIFAVSQKMLFFWCIKQWLNQIIAQSFLRRPVIPPAALPSPVTTTRLLAGVTRRVVNTRVPPGLADSTIQLYSLLAACMGLLLFSLSLALVVFLRGGKAKSSETRHPKAGDHKQEHAVQLGQELGHRGSQAGKSSNG